MGTTTRRKTLSLIGIGTIAAIAGCSDANGSEQTAVLGDVERTETDGGEAALQVRLESTAEMSTVELTAGETTVDTQSVDSDTTAVELTPSESEFIDRTYEITALDAAEETVDSVEWSPSSTIIVEDVSVSRRYEHAGENFRRISVDLRNTGDSPAEAIDAYVQEGFPLSRIGEGTTTLDRVGRIRDTGEQRDIDPGEEVDLVIVSDTAGGTAEDRILDPGPPCGEGGEPTSETIEVRIEFADELDKILSIDIDFDGEHRNFSPFGCETINVAEWEKV